VKDLVVLVPDGNTQLSVRTLLAERRPDLAIREITFNVPKHPGHDGGVMKNAPEFLSVYRNSHRYAVVMLDVEFDGSPGSADQIKEALEGRLNNRGWQNRSRVIAIDPELEEWAWCAPYHTLQALTATADEVRRIADGKGWWDPESQRFTRPKELFREVARAKQIAGPTRLFPRLAREISVGRCRDPAFALFRDTLRQWFGILEPDTPESR
jgi:hypothetical protein